MKAPNPIAFALFGMDVRWYGLFIGIGFLLAIFLSYKRAPKYGIKEDNVLDFALFLIPAAVIGARAYYVIFNWDYYGGDFSRILDIRSGGLAIHGGLIAGEENTAVFHTDVFNVQPAQFIACQSFQTEQAGNGKFKIRHRSS